MRLFIIFFSKINVEYKFTLTVLSFVIVRFLFSKKYVSASNLFNSGLKKVGFHGAWMFFFLKKSLGVWDIAPLLQPGISNWK